jgi:acyl-CoA reductase-like NAD-dependent aldehyde dehydrogenase
MASADVSSIVAGLEPTAELVTEEVLGPVLAVQVFDDDAEAITLANNTIYGLAASVWTNDLRRAHTVAGALRAGTVSVNRVDALSAKLRSAASNRAVSGVTSHCTRWKSTRASRPRGSVSGRYERVHPRSS